MIPPNPEVSRSARHAHSRSHPFVPRSIRSLGGRADHRAGAADPGWFSIYPTAGEWRLVRTRRRIPAGPHPPRQAGGVEYVPPSTAAATTPSAKSLSPAETHPEASPRSGIRRSGHSKPRTGSCSATAHRAPSHRSGSVSSWHGNSLLSFIPWSSQYRTSGTSSARRALHAHAVRDARISDTGSCRRRPRQGDRPCDLGPVRRDPAPVRRLAPFRHVFFRSSGIPPC